ncbi:MAG: hypothetical protein JXM70_18455, partial [Pirellulales bacterium]|nr:hypothetical protein [Pirellulales bacterium]
HHTSLPLHRIRVPTLRGQPRGEWPDGTQPGIRWALVPKVGKCQIDFSIQKLLLGNYGIHDVLNLHPRILCFRSAWVRCHHLHVKLERRGQIAFRILCGVRRRILPARLRKLSVVSHVRCSFQKKTACISRA